MSEWGRDPRTIPVPSPKQLRSVPTLTPPGPDPKRLADIKVTITSTAGLHRREEPPYTPGRAITGFCQTIGYQQTNDEPRIDLFRPHRARAGREHGLSQRPAPRNGRRLRNLGCPIAALFLYGGSAVLRDGTSGTGPRTDRMRTAERQRVTSSSRSRMPVEISNRFLSMSKAACSTNGRSGSGFEARGSNGSRLCSPIFW